MLSICTLYLLISSQIWYRFISVLYFMIGICRFYCKIFVFTRYLKIQVAYSYSHVFITSSLTNINIRGNRNSWNDEKCYKQGKSAFSQHCLLLQLMKVTVLAESSFSFHRVLYTTMMSTDASQVGVALFPLNWGVWCKLDYSLGCPLYSDLFLVYIDLSGDWY